MAGDGKVWALATNHLRKSPDLNPSCRMRGYSLDECNAKPVINKGKEPLQDDTMNPNGAKEKPVAGQGETSKAAESVKPVTRADRKKKSRTAWDWEVFGCA